MAARPTFSPAHLLRQREAHRHSDGYGRHRHIYLHPIMRTLAACLRAEPCWLDYGCGKGMFIEQIRPFGLFSKIVGYDPAVDGFADKPAGRFDLVTCLDVIDTAETQFIPAILDEIAAAAADGVALFDCLTRPKPGGRLRPHAPFYWTRLVGQAMAVIDTRVEFPGVEGFERVLILAAPAGGACSARLRPA